jgi:hypothetical protein
MSDLIIRCMECSYFGSEREMRRFSNGHIDCPKCYGELYYTTRWETEEEMGNEYPGCLLIWDKMHI